MGGFWALVHRFRTDWRWTLALMAPNLAGIAFGYYYYWDVGQINPASAYYVDWWWWPFVADSPNAVLLMSVALVGWHLGLRSRVLDSLAFLHMAFVGIWTTYLFLLYPAQLGTFEWAAVPGNANPVLFVTHMAMPLQALILVPDLRGRVAWPGVAAMAAWGALLLWFDYGPPGLRPAPFLRVGPELWVGSSLIMLAVVAAWTWIGRAPAAPPHESARRAA